MGRPKDADDSALIEQVLKWLEKAEVKGTLNVSQFEDGVRVTIDATLKPKKVTTKKRKVVKG